MVRFSKKRTLEDQLNSMMIDLAKIAVHLKKEREKEAQQKLEEERKRQEAEQLRQKQLLEKERIEYLEAIYAQWIKAKQLREFLALAEGLPSNLTLLE